MRKAVAVLCCALLLGAACGGDDGDDAAAPSEVTGVILDIESEGIGQVTSFELKDGDETYEIFIAGDVDYGFDLGHLNEHLTTGDPVRVPLEERGGKLYARSIDDA